jgi:hypothetical protein
MQSANKINQKEKDRDDNIALMYNRRDFLDKVKIDLANSFDKYLLTFATGTLYLSITFTNSLKTKLIYKELLRNGWIMLLAAIVFSLISIGLSIVAYQKEIKTTDEDLTSLIENKPLKDHCNCWNYFISLLQIIATLGFIVGIFYLTAFYFFNL